MVAIGSILVFSALVVSLIGMIISTVMTIVVVDKNGIGRDNPDRETYDVAEYIRWASFGVMLLTVLILYFASSIGKKDSRSAGKVMTKNVGGKKTIVVEE